MFLPRPGSSLRPFLSSPSPPRGGGGGGGVGVWWSGVGVGCLTARRSAESRQHAGARRRGDREAVIEAAAREQLVVRAALDDASFVQDEDLIGALGRGEAGGG